MRESPESEVVTVNVVYDIPRHSPGRPPDNLPPATAT